MREYFETLDLVEKAMPNFYEIEDVEICKGERFSVENNFLADWEITVAKLGEKTVGFQKDYFSEFLSEEVKKVDWMIKPELIAFLHEIGHIYHYEECDFATDLVLKKSLKMQHKDGIMSDQEYYNAYRKIHCEELADQFAIVFINKHYIKLAAICQNTSPENVELFIM